MVIKTHTCTHAPTHTYAQNSLSEAHAVCHHADGTSNVHFVTVVVVVAAVECVCASNGVDRSVAEMQKNLTKAK